MLSWILGYSTTKEDPVKKLSEIKEDDLRNIIEGLYPTKLPGLCRNAPRSFAKFKRLLQEPHVVIAPEELIMEKKMLNISKYTGILENISTARAYIERSENIDGVWERIPRPPPLPCLDTSCVKEHKQDKVSIQINDELLAGALNNLAPIPEVPAVEKLESSFLFNILGTKSALKKVESQNSAKWETPPLFCEIRSFNKNQLRSIV